MWYPMCVKCGRAHAKLLVCPYAPMVTRNDSPSPAARKKAAAVPAAAPRGQRATAEPASPTMRKLKPLQAKKNKALANILANVSSTYKHRDADARRAYQAELMRKRRAAAKKGKR